MIFGKINQYNFHYWYRNGNYGKWSYGKDSHDNHIRFYAALHTPASESLIDMEYLDAHGRWHQVWAYIKRYNGI